MTHLHISVPAITRGTLARTHELKRKLRKHLKGDRTTLKNFKPFNVILTFTIKRFLLIGSSLEAF